MSNRPSPVILSLIPLLVFSLLLAPLVIDSYDIVDVVEFNPSKYKTNGGNGNGDTRLYGAGDIAGSVTSSATVWFDDGSKQTFDQDESLAVTLTKPLSSFVLSPDKTDRADRIKYSINYDIDDFEVIESTADFTVLACPLSDYCDEQGSPNTVILCGDTHNPCEVGFVGASPFVVVDLERFQTESPEPLFREVEEIRFLFKAEYVSVKLQSKADGTLYEATTERLMSIADLPTDNAVHVDERIFLDGPIEPLDFMDEDLELDINDVVKRREMDVKWNCREY